jgi:hypothetical protein
MDLLPDERKRLDDIEGILRAEMSGVASMFDIFTRLTRDDGKPPAEGQFRTGGSWRAEAFARHRARRRRHLILAILLAVPIAILILELS